MDKYVEKANYTLDVLADLIENKPNKLEYEGKFRNEDIIYRLNHIKV
jgi:ethanolamine utilization protein EutJ